MLELSTHHSIRDVGRATWGALLPEAAPPFLHYDFLEALEQTGCVRPEVGWLPSHVLLKQNGRVVAAAPAYVKGNSEGEFVFDHGWARFAYDRLGVEYYPKLIVAVPFTPATGPRLLIAPGADRKHVLEAFAAGLGELVQGMRVSSAHVLFPVQAEAQSLEAAGLVRRSGLQYHWKNDGYGSFDDFAARFSSKRRNQLRREIREMHRQGVELETITGSDFRPEIVDAAYSFYLSTVNKYFWGRQYLNRAFFEEICSKMSDRVLVVLARDRASRRPIGGAFNLLGARALYGRYWGARQEVSCLHFNVCYYHGIRECIERGLELFEPGAGGEHKVTRGFEPTETHSLHVLADHRLDAVVRDFCERERQAIQAHQEEYAGAPILKPRGEAG